MKLNFENLRVCDISLIKLSVLAATLFLISIWDGFANWAMNTHWAWFLVATLVFAIKPVLNVFKK